MMKILSRIMAVCVALGTWPGPIAAQNLSGGQAVAIELNTVTPTAEGCTLTFLTVNNHPDPIEKVVYEAVLFDQQGQVVRLTLFDFGTLPPARPRVRQFSVPGPSCDGLGKILINGAHTCDAATLNDTACEQGLHLTTRTKIEVIG